jgi:hypothetical protein
MTTFKGVERKAKLIRLDYYPSGGPLKMNSPIKVQTNELDTGSIKLVFYTIGMPHNITK